MTYPNIILITADGSRWDALGCHGNPDAKTPNIDALAGHGVLFSQAMSPWVLDASGGHTFLTGAAPEGWAPGACQTLTGQETLLLPAALRSVGYTTGAVGALDAPAERFRGYFDEIHGLDDDFEAWLRERGIGESGSRSESSHPTTWVGDEATRYVRSAVEPFFLWVNMPRPRPPFDPPAPWNELHRPARIQLLAGTDIGPEGRLVARTGLEGREDLSERDLRAAVAAWHGSMGHVDRQVGRILGTLTARGRSNNLIAFTAGRGAWLGFGGLLNTPPDLPFEPVSRIPMMVCGAGVTRKGEIDPALVSLADLVPTLLDLVEVPAGAPRGSTSFAAQLRESGLPHRKSVILAGRGCLGIRTTRYKLIEGVGPDHHMLYDLQTDPEERHNVHEERSSPAIRRMLLATLGSGTAEPAL